MIASMPKLKIRKIGDSAGVTLSPDLLKHLGVGVGDELVAERTLRGVELHAADSFGGKMAVARRVMKTDRVVLKQLAKS